MTLMDQIRHVLGVLAMVVYVPGLLFWFVIHPWAPAWRRLGAAPTYLIVGSILATLGVLLFRIREYLLGPDFGTNWTLITVSVVIYAAFVWLGLRYARRMSHLSLATRMGIPELSRTGGQQKLVRDGVYLVVRHPVYVIAAVWGIAYAIVVNYLGAYILFVSAFPVFLAITVLEERELIDRFGDDYRDYQREVPRFMPNWWKGGQHDRLTSNRDWNRRRRG